MKKGLLLVMILVLALSVGAFGLEDEPEGLKIKNVLSTNPLGFVQGVVNLKYERVLSPELSIVLDPRFMLGQASGVGIMAGVRNYPSGTAPEGFFVGGSGLLAFVSAGPVTGQALGFGGDIGYKWILDNGFAFEAGLGLKYLSVTASYLWYSATESGLVATYLFGLGYAF